MTMIFGQTKGKNYTW